MFFKKNSSTSLLTKNIFKTTINEFDTNLYPSLDLTKEVIDFDLIASIPLELMLEYHFVPIYKKNNLLYLAISDPFNILIQDTLRERLKCSIQFIGASDIQITEILEKAESGQRVMDEVEEVLRIQSIHDEDVEENIDFKNFTDKEEAPIIRLVDTTIFNALQRRASDIHMETTNSGFQLKYRIDGSLYKVTDVIDKSFASSIISRVKIMSELDITERRKPQDGRFKLKVRGTTIDFRVSIMPTIHGEDAVIRILDKSYLGEELKSLRLDSLGISNTELFRIRKYAREPYGMFLVTGPTGSGKTTTLYALISELHSPEDKFITIEDPVEYQLDGITQIPVNEKKGLSFAVGLRSILRHDPDKIMVGEIRDHETAQIAVQSALTGHLMLTTIHANHTMDVISRFQNMGVEVANFASALNCILAQRLVRSLCIKCKRETSSVNNVDILENNIDKIWLKNATLFEKVGCTACNNTGFRGRQAITEFMVINDNIRELITHRRYGYMREIKTLARNDGTISLRESAIEKVQLGLTTFDEINKVTFRELN